MQPQVDIEQLSKDKLVTVTKKVTPGQDGEELPYLELEKKRFDPHTGEAIEPEVQTLNPVALKQQLEQLKTGKATVEQQIANIEFLLSKFDE